MEILALLKEKDISIQKLASLLDVSTSQIYTWNRKGISRHNPHFYKLKEILPEIQPKEQLLKNNGEEDGRYRAGRKKRKLTTLKETDLNSPAEKEFTSTLFPRVYVNKKTT